jgi:hypothetical protein
VHHKRTIKLTLAAEFVPPNDRTSKALICRHGRTAKQTVPTNIGQIFSRCIPEPCAIIVKSGFPSRPYKPSDFACRSLAARPRRRGDRVAVFLLRRVNDANGTKRTYQN